MARFDYVTLGPRQLRVLPALRDLNPDILILTSSNACELKIDTRANPDATTNLPLMDVPNKWIQTQLGSTLSAAVSSTTTQFYVEDLTRFRAGDILIIGDELALVSKVGTGSLTVVRGLIAERSPAAAHALGTRVAAAVVFWPGSIVMDLSDYCPRVIVDASVGPETWAQYQARHDLSLLKQSAVDGIFLDRTNAGAYVNKVYTRSIDPLRNNIPVTDGYVGLTRSWNSGLRRYQSLIRAGAPKALILANNGAPNYDLLNGTVFENAPRAASSVWGVQNWMDLLFGSGSRSYSQFMKLARQPNLSMFETYEIEGSPVSGTSFVNPALNPSWRPNYRKMRYGLTSALMNNGFFAHNVGTFGHATLGIMWFDEYDNAGKQTGYLGQPISAARRAFPPLATTDLLKGGGAFSSSTQLRNWQVVTQPGYAVSKSGSSGTARLDVSRSKGELYGATIKHPKFSVQKNTAYTLTFRARASKPISLGLGAFPTSGSKTNYLPFGRVAVGTSWQTYKLITTSTGACPSAAITFAIGQAVGTVWLDDVKLQTGWRPEVHVRDFQYGLAAVNPEGTNVQVNLGGVYRRINGRQDPVTNNGVYVSSVTLGAQDGLILLKTPPLTISGNRTLNYGAPATVGGSLKAVSGAPLGGKPIELLSSTNGGSWTKLTTKTTSSSGTYGFSAKPKLKTYYKVRFYGDSANLQGFSNVMKVEVRAAVRTPMAPRTMRASKAKTIQGYLYPRHQSGSAPVRIYKYRYVKGKWKSYGYVNAKASNYGSYTKYSRSISLPRKGKWRLRAYHSDSGHAKSWSGSDYVTVK